MGSIPPDPAVRPGLMAQAGVEPTATLFRASSPDSWVAGLLALVMMSFITWMLALIASGLWGHATDREIDRIDVGAVISAREVPTAWNDRPRTRIECDKGTFFVDGVHSILKGRAARVGRYQTGREYLFVEGKRYGWEVY